MGDKSFVKNKYKNFLVFGFSIYIALGILVAIFMPSKVLEFLILLPGFLALMGAIIWNAERSRKR